MEKLDYEQTMTIVEDFMVRSGIAGFCRKVCKGSCCGSCWTGPGACHKNEGRRLACTVFICGKLFDRIYGHIYDDQRLWNKIHTSYSDVKFMVSNTVEAILISSTGREKSNPYFCVPDMERMRGDFKIYAKKLKKFFNEENIKLVRWDWLKPNHYKELFIC